MERRGRIRSEILILATSVFCLIGLQGCNTCDDTCPRASIRIRIDDGSFATRSFLPEEEKVTDISLMIFDSNGLIEKMLYLENGINSCSVNLLKGETYSIYACANFGYQVKVSSIGQLRSLRYHLAYPDEYRSGIPMYAEATGLLITEKTCINLELKRLMAKISLRIDRSNLSEDVSMIITDVSIGNCPKNIWVFQESHAEDEDDCFKAGFFLDDNLCAPLNRSDAIGMSEEVSLYMLENMQGRFSEDNLLNDDEKVFSDTDKRRHSCSYIELSIDYSSPDRHSIDTPLKYRFYLGEDINSLNIERNCHYHITVSPEDDGLKGDGWRVDKTGIIYTGETELQQYPGEYLVGDIGDKIHIGCFLKPSDTPFDVGIEYMEADKAEGIYDYQIDPDGHGATLTLTGPGCGMIYMEAGPPINDAALFLIEVNQP